MKHKYEVPELDITYFDDEDIVTTVSEKYPSGDPLVDWDELFGEP